MKYQELSHIWLVVSTLNELDGEKFFTIVDGVFYALSNAEKMKRRMLKRWPKISCGVVKLTSFNLPGGIKLVKEETR